MKTKERRFDVGTVVKAGFLVAISIVLTRFASVLIPIGGVQGLRLSFGELPIMIAGFLFGPIIGGLTGIAADLIGVLVNPMGPYFPGFTISSMMWGVIPGIIMIISGNGRSFSLKKILISVTISYLLISLVLNTLWISMLYGSAFIVLLPPRILSSVASIPIMGLILNTLLNRLKAFGNL